jgi:hypothetical protein
MRLATAAGKPCVMLRCALHNPSVTAAARCDTKLRQFPGTLPHVIAALAASNGRGRRDEAVDDDDGRPFGASLKIDWSVIVWSAMYWSPMSFWAGRRNSSSCASGFKMLGGARASTFNTFSRADAPHTSRWAATSRCDGM